MEDREQDDIVQDALNGGFISIDNINSIVNFPSEEDNIFGMPKSRKSSYAHSTNGYGEEDYD